jgi:hypothetical protein
MIWYKNSLFSGKSSIAVSEKQLFALAFAGDRVPWLIMNKYLLIQNYIKFGLFIYLFY